MTYERISPEQAMLLDQRTITKRKATTVLQYVSSIGITLFMLFPLYWVFTVVLAEYGFSKGRFKGQKYSFLLVLWVLMILSIEADKPDDMGRLGIITQVLVPMCKSTLITIAFATFINSWNSYFRPKIIAKNETRRVLTVGLVHRCNTFARFDTMNNHEIMEGAVLVVLPVIVLLFMYQKYMLTVTKRLQRNKEGVYESLRTSGIQRVVS